MALTINTNIKNEANGYSLDASQVKGGYVVVADQDERDTIPAATKVNGTTIYQADVGKEFRWDETKDPKQWVEVVTSGVQNIEDGSGVNSIKQKPDGETFSGLQKGLTENETTIEYSTDAAGQNSTILGGKNRAEAKRSTAIGGYNVAAGASSLATGEQTITEGRCSFSTGQRTRAKGGSSLAAGGYSLALGDFSMTQGYQTKASGRSAMATGAGTSAEGAAALSGGTGTKAVGDNSTAVGISTTATGNNSFAGGNNSEAVKNGSFVYGFGLKSNQENQAVFGTYNISYNPSILVVGNGNATKLSNAFEVYQDGRAKVQTAPKDNDDVTRKGDFKTINGNSILGSGDLVIEGGGTEVTPNPTLSGSEAALSALQIGDTKYRIEGSLTTLMVGIDSSLLGG